MKCKVCEREMATDEQGCKKNLVWRIGEKDFHRILHIAFDGENCPDCGCPDLTPHHPGCDMEVCPECGGQAICCDCDYDGLYEITLA